MFNKVEVKLPDALNTMSFNEALVHQVVMAYMAGARAGTVKQKTRSEVRGGGKKPWKQKGTGRARAGTIRSPLWKGGGVTFAATPRDYSQKVNKKMFKGAFASIVSELFKRGLITVVEDLERSDISSKVMKQELDKLGFVGRILLISEDWDKSEESRNLFLSARNLRNIYMQDIGDLDPYSLSCVDNIVITRNAFEELVDRCDYV